MNFFQSLLNKIKSFKKAQFHLQPEHHVKLAFTYKGVDYFWFDDAFNTPAERTLDGLNAYNEVNTRCDRPFLEALVKANEVERAKKSINIGVWFSNDGLLKERLNFVIPPRRFILKLAAIMFFDKSENPYRYDDKYGAEKIANWEKDTDLVDFFLSLPIKNLIFSTEHSKEDLATFLRVVELIDHQHLLSLSQQIKSGPQSPASHKVLQSIQEQIKHIGSLPDMNISSH